MSIDSDYIYDIDFNTKFEQDKMLNKKQFASNDLNRLQSINPEQNNISKFSIYNILISIKDTWFNIIDGLLQGNFNSNLFTQNNSLLYIGITIVVLAVIYFILVILFDDNSNCINPVSLNPSNINVKNPVKIVYVYE